MSSGRGVVAAVVLVLAGTGCGTSEPTTAPTTSSSTSRTPSSSAATTTTTPADEVTQRVLAAYTNMWIAMADAGRTSDWQSPELAKYARDDALDKITKSLYDDAERGITSRGRPVLSPRVTDLVPSQAPTEARVEDCGDGGAWLRYDADGELVDDEPGGRRRIAAIVRLEGDDWKVVDFAIREVGSC